jgi:hypothetical protein
MYYVLCFQLLLIQTHQRWIIFKTIKRKTLSSLRSKASESLFNNAYYFFLALFTNYVIHEIMNHCIFTLLHYFM